MSTLSDEPAWKQRAVERSTKAARLRAERKVQQFLEAAQEIILEKGSTDFTVQEVVDRSHQSLRSFYQHFGGKHELLLALFENALRRSADEIRAAAAAEVDPLAGLEVGIRMLFESSLPDPSTRHPLFTDFATQLLMTYPAEVRSAHEPMLSVFAELMTRVDAVGQLRTSLRPRRAAAMVMQSVMFLAQSTAVAGESEGAHPLTTDEVWDFCSGGFARHAEG
ncbi:MULTISPECIES: TetR/AcrR family transcriptional regulator [unclassified Pseudofrankia]|uniref:TetR/AcrR family transcriptional regulator n=1 Tax=unclassified Pseudofrankia TaxID=2994372 RepID=UPI0008DA68D4|nr:MULTISPECIES: TetR/AcrR family transcriptional regulator [unclassified Pseudofrankia]MDT3444097.1 TetR/AcrR family transcriptional regulator [Pseudofrankia sp. BMG5.37]OHV65434.1 TetR family transcriptional regulator [Pseudofrankia sp. BMG5.36]